MSATPIPPPGKGVAALALVGWLLLSFSAAVFGSRFSPGDWYASLTKPSWNPPNWVFGPVWTLLYTMMGVAAWLVWRRGRFAANRLPLALFLGQLVLNALWSWVFFGLHRPGWAFVEIGLLWCALLATLITFWRRQRLAGALLLPYLAWVSFAAVLNFSLWQLNR